MEVDARTLGWLALAAIALLQTARLEWRRVSRRRRLRRRRDKARAGEHEAEALLARAGYRVLARQVRGQLDYRVDGAAHTAEVIADLLVARRGHRFIAEVKTGRAAPDPLHRATRRQLLEYSLAFDVSGVLLVDAETGQVRTFTPPTRGSRSHAWAWLLAGVAFGWALTMIAD